MRASNIEIKSLDKDGSMFTEIYIDGHKLHGVRSFELKQEVCDSIPTLTVDLNALYLSTDLRVLELNQKGMRGIKEIVFED